MKTENGWKAGIAKVCITPDEPMWLAGFAMRTRPSEGILQDIYLKSLALEDETGAVSILITADLLGFSRALCQRIARQVEERFGISREHLLMNASHNHSSPVTEKLLVSYYEMNADQQLAVQRYTARMEEQLLEIIGEAIANLAPATLAFGQTLAGFGVNRRRARPGCRHLPGPTDHDVPVLRINDEEGQLRAAVFGYACHTTALSGYEISGDYAGFAQAELESAFPGATALFVAGCGGDINPLPRFQTELAQMYGKILATSVESVLRGEMQPANGRLRAAFQEATLPLETPPTRAELQRLALGHEGQGHRGAEELLAALDRGEVLPEKCFYSVQVWRLGESLTLIALGGEPVVDYSLRFKDRYGWDNVWVAGYSNDYLAYIPSRRVLGEGGYEGTDAMMEFRLPAPFTPQVEEIIASKVEQLVCAVGDSA